MLQLSDDHLKAVTGKAKVRFFYAGSLFAGMNVTMKSDNNEVYPPYLPSFNHSDYMEVHPDKYSVTINGNPKRKATKDLVSSNNKI